jgi:hypothetical protein
MGYTGATGPQGPKGDVGPNVAIVKDKLGNVLGPLLGFAGSTQYPVIRELDRTGTTYLTIVRDSSTGFTVIPYRNAYYTQANCGGVPSYDGDGAMIGQLVELGGAIEYKVVGNTGGVTALSWQYKSGNCQNGPVGSPGGSLVILAPTGMHQIAPIGGGPLVIYYP